MEERYRSDYEGEFIITNSVVRGGKKIQDKEWIENPIQNQHISGRAVCIADGASRSQFPTHRLENHKGGLLGRLRLQTYGTGRVADEIMCNFYVSRQPTMLEKCIEKEYTIHTACYTSTTNCLKYPGEFYLVPYKLLGSDSLLAAYIACFDGHKEIFLLGYDYINDKTTTTELTDLMNTYKGTKFTRVSSGVKTNQTDNQTPEDWKWCTNFSEMTYAEWISYCDV
jgi:hypothetical protein